MKRRKRVQLISSCVFLVSFLCISWVFLVSVAVRFSLIEWGESLGESGKKAKLRREGAPVSWRRQPFERRRVALLLGLPPLEGCVDCWTPLLCKENCDRAGHDQRHVRLLLLTYHDYGQKKCKKLPKINLLLKIHKINVLVFAPPPPCWGVVWSPLERKRCLGGGRIMTTEPTENRTMLRFGPLLLSEK